MTPFRNEKNSNWEGAFRVPEMIRWPGKIPAGVVSNEIIASRLATHFPGGRGRTRDCREVEAGAEAGEKTFKVHLDGYNLLPYLPGKRRRAPGRDSSTSPTMAIWRPSLRQLEVCLPGATRAWDLEIWAEPFVPLRVPKFFNLRTDPFERADITSNTYYDWLIDRLFFLPARRSWGSSWTRSRRSRRARRRPASPSIRSMEKMHAGHRGATT